MKKLISLGYVIGLAFLLASCVGSIMNNEDDNNGSGSDVSNYEPGAIPGIGSAEGELTGTPFVLPEGVSIIGDIAANGSSYGYWNFSEAKDYQITNKDGSVTTGQILPKTNRNDSLTYHYFGSGSGLVELIIPLHNSNNNSVTVTFPAALVVRNLAGNCQNGILLKKAVVVIPANSDYYLNLSFYCANLTKDTPGESDLYTFAVVSDADPLLELCDMLKNKKINIEEFDPTKTEDQTTFETQAAMLQLIVWAVTDSTGLSGIYNTYVNSLPNSES